MSGVDSYGDKELGNKSSYLMELVAAANNMFQKSNQFFLYEILFLAWDGGCTFVVVD